MRKGSKALTTSNQHPKSD